jgi:hypothetical protein
MCVSAFCSRVDRKRDAKRAADDQEQAAFPLNVPAQRPQIGGLHADTAGHHQRHCLHRLENPQQDSARDRGERKPGKAGDKGAGEHGDAQQEIGRQIRHVFGPLANKLVKRQ